MNNETSNTILGFAAAAVIGIIIIWICCINESATYNRLTGAHTTAWDAMWVELRIQDQPHK